jgi:hypothetical protein
VEGIVDRYYWLMMMIVASGGGEELCSFMELSTCD